MPLITQISEIRAKVPRLSNLSNNANLPDISKAQRKYINPLLGNDFLNDLQTKYTNNTLSLSETELVSFIQSPLAAFAMLDDLAFIQSMITDNGLRTTETQSQKAAHRWEYLEVKNSLNDIAVDGVEVLLNYLYENKADYALWTNSNEYKDFNAFLIRSGDDFNKHYRLYQPNYTYWLLRPVITDVEELYIAPVLGRDLFNWIKEQQEIIITAEGGQVDVKKLLKKSVANFTIKQAPFAKFGPNGFTVPFAGGDKDDSRYSDQQNADHIAIEQHRYNANREGQNYLTKCSKYLQGIFNGEFNEDFGDDFNIAFTSSPLNITSDEQVYEDYNKGKKGFYFGSLYKKNN